MQVCLVVLVHITFRNTILGELDPERVGSGIQYGNASVRRISQQGQKEGGGGKDKCSC